MTQPTEKRRFVDRAVLSIERIAGLMLGGVTLLIVVSAIGRYGFARPLPDAFDASRLLLGVAIAWGMASVAWHGSHIKVDIVAQAVGARARLWLSGFAWAVLLLFTLAMTWKIGERVEATFRSGDTTMDLRLPHWPFFLAIWLGLVAALVTTGLRLWRIVVHGSDLEEFDGAEAHTQEDQQK
ncbi:TRAP transporter small permease [Vannielia litorea]|uniref:TRAP transporter small permease n=1 Tax=Vannielia litorea TaxID=1217970 RepID=UPI001C97B109|nr:TRAP transporter small permease [Vannielia litorea]MBY6154383.1 TRAP transporter small permease [Vannielia litorea]